MEFASSELVRLLPQHYFSSLYKKVDELAAQGVDVINWANGNPDLPTPPHIVEALQKAVDDPQNHGYPPFFGKRSLREAVALFYKREYGVELDPETEIAVMQGTGVGITGIPQAVLDPGDTMITANPCYPAYRVAALMARANVYEIPVFEDEGFLPDYSRVPADVAKKAKLLVLNYPNNPTGVVATRPFLEESVRFAGKHGIALLHDFAYGAFGFDGHRPISLMQIEGGKEVGIETYTLSKTYNMAGWRLGIAVGNASLIRAYRHLHSHAYSTIFGAIQDAAAAALTGPQDSVEALRQLYERRRHVLVEGLRSAGWQVRAPQGTFFAWFRVPDGYNSRTFTEALLEKADIVVAPGEGFGTNGEQYVRVNLLNSEERIREAIERVKRSGLFG
jgi:aminotransferase